MSVVRGTKGPDTFGHADAGGDSFRHEQTMKDGQHSDVGTGRELGDQAPKKIFEGRQSPPPKKERSA